MGDEDLLEIIGNSKNIPRLQKHFKKMFAGVTAIILDENETIVTGIASREGEEVSYSNIKIVTMEKIAKCILAVCLSSAWLANNFFLYSFRLPSTSLYLQLRIQRSMNG